MTIRMGYWDCPSCNAKKNLGPNATCASCGRPRGPNIPFYTDDSAPVVEDPELVARARAGADWKCKYCNADNRAGVMDCAQCGAGPDGAVRRAERTILDKPPEPKRSLGRVLALVGGVVALLGILVWAVFLRTTELVMTVEQVTWVRSAVVEALESRRESSWADEVPSGAHRVSSETRSRTKHVQDGTTKVKVGKKDLGNGMFEDIYETKPKYVDKQIDDEWVTYDVDKWVQRDKLEKKTSDGTEPDDPAAGQRVGDKLRVGEKTSRISLGLRGSNGKAYTYDFDADGSSAGKRFKKGERYKARVNAVGGVVALGP
jgi:hypothetical protein